ncbi:MULTISPECIES: peptidylprolyl isomerase [unclassified Janthinobacterium]|uniref:peptidylprolyl isomerase n=1 Tax=unclassified Janthinobacterium TaxID=2610881 RepID=UPI00034D11DE|nr:MULTISPECIES: peptidylprolyl isomerase [unclassified Janthinobacterium]MEC5160367.1 peptidyl-prolyl cis-trans isomerase C [Janthinobacterium sp. CG_S6]
MGISVNGVDITDHAIEQELPHHQDAGNPLKQSVHELVLRSVLLHEADRLAIGGADDDARIEALFAQEVKVPEADAAACATFYRNQPRRFSSGAMVEARHILFQVTPEVPLELLRATGQAVLAELRIHPERFADLAREYSNCPSGAVGGSLGQLPQGQTVPEFDKLLFRLAPGALADHLLESRFGLHIVQVLRRVDGAALPFDAVHAQIADRLKRAAWQRGLHQYLRILVGRADVEGVALEGADTPLVQ